jgi:hypothetical protein
MKWILSWSWSRFLLLCVFGLGTSCGSEFSDAQVSTEAGESRSAALSGDVVTRDSLGPIPDAGYSVDTSAPEASTDAPSTELVRCDSAACSDLVKASHPTWASCCTLDFHKCGVLVPTPPFACLEVSR